MDGIIPRSWSHKIDATLKRRPLSESWERDTRHLEREINKNKIWVRLTFSFFCPALTRKCQIGLAELESSLSKTLVIVYIWIIMTAYDYTRFYICGWHGMEYYTVTPHWCRIVGTAQAKLSCSPVNLRFCSDLKATASRCTEWGRGKVGDSISASVAGSKLAFRVISSVAILCALTI